MSSKKLAGRSSARAKSGKRRRPSATAAWLSKDQEKKIVQSVPVGLVVAFHVLRTVEEVETRTNTPTPPP